MTDGPPKGTLGTIHNAATLLQLMADGPSHHQLTELADRSGMSLATLHRLMRSLTAAGLAEQNPHSSRYGLGPELVRLADCYLSRHPILTVGAPYAVELRNATGATVLVATLVSHDLVVLDRIDGLYAGGVYRDSRRIHDPSTSALGRVLLAHDDQAWDAVAKEAGFTDSDRTDWRQAEVLVHAPESPADVPDVAAPIRERGGRVSAAIGVLVDQRVDTPDELRKEFGPPVIRAASTISRVSGGT